MKESENEINRAERDELLNSMMIMLIIIPIIIDMQPANKLFEFDFPDLPSLKNVKLIPFEDADVHAKQHVGQTQSRGVCHCEFLSLLKRKFPDF